MADTEPTSRNRIDDMYPLSPMQQGLLFHALLDPRRGLYMPHIVIDLAGRPDRDQLREAWAAVIRSHPVLRTGFFWEQRDQPFQLVSRTAPLPWTEQDWRSVSPAEQDGRLENFLTASRAEPFDLHRPPLMRLSWIRRADERFTLIWAYHHLILDGWSAARVLEQVFLHLISAARHLVSRAAPQAGRFADYVAWLSRRDQAATEAFWRQHLNPSVAASTLPLPAVGEDARRPGAGHREKNLGPDNTERLRRFARAEQVTLNTLMQGAFALLLARYNDSRSVIFGNTVAGRPADLPGAESTIGLFVNTLPVQVDVPAHARVGEWLRALQQRQAATVAHEHVALHDLQAWLNDGRSMFECLFVFESYPVPALPHDGNGDGEDALLLEGVAFDEQTHLPLTLQVADGESLRITARYHGTRFAHDDIERLLDHLSRLTLLLAASPYGKLHEHSPLSHVEREQLATWNRTAWPLPAHETLVDWLTAQADATPDRTALRCGDQSFSYRELHTQANRLAHLLVRRGVGAESLVAIHIARSPTMVIGILAALKAGAAYLPLDPDQPPARLSVMLDDARPALLLHDSRQGLSGAFGDTRIERLDLSLPLPGPLPSHHPDHGLDGDNAIYVIYTSGSTGKPKGVVNTHRALVNRLAWMQRRYEIGGDDRVLHKTPLGFDVSAWELFWPLVAGATLVVAAPESHRDADYLAELVREAGVTTMHFVPPMLGAFLDTASSNCAGLRRVICSGEALPAALQRRFFENLPNTELHNLYGPTEAAIDVTAWQCQPDSGAASVPIGRPIDNTAIHLLDGNLEPVPVGIPGELYIGGINLARGYLNNPTRTADAFVPNPFAGPDVLGEPAAARCLYRSGDLARWRADGSIEYLGRRDHQVKLRGVRIELGDIEATLLAHSSVSAACVILRHDTAGGPQLVAYIVAAPSPDHDPVALETIDWLSFLAPRLTPAMIPGAFVVLAELPLTVNGKIDRRRLPAPGTERLDEFVAPRNPTEQIVAEVWSEVLGIDRVGAHADFLALGGHSLNATRVNTRLRKRLSVDLPLHAHFRYPTLEALATHIDALRVAIDAKHDREAPTTSSGASKQVDFEI